MRYNVIQNKMLNNMLHFYYFLTWIKNRCDPTTFPKGVKCLLLHLDISLFICVIFSDRLKSSVSDRPTENFISCCVNTDEQLPGNQ